MAGDWIKMRGGLFSSPKLIAMAKILHKSHEFRDWLTPGGAGQVNGQIVSDGALRCVTGALLCVTWSWSREFGKVLPNGDCYLPFVCCDDIDEIAGAPSVGGAMRYVGWAIDSEDPPGVILPKFFIDHNVPLSPAEKQRAYRERKKRYQSVTETLPNGGNKTVTREEKRREDKNKKTPTPFDPVNDVAAEFPFQGPDFVAAWLDFCSMRKEIKKPLTKTAVKALFKKLAEMGLSDAVAALDNSTANQWQGVFPPDKRRNAKPEKQNQNLDEIEAEAERIRAERCRA